MPYFQFCGAITVDSEVFKGKTFNLFLPLYSGETVNNPVSPDLVQGYGCTLIIDDEQVIRVTAKSTLKSLGYDVILAENGKDCFKALKEINPEVSGVLFPGFSREEYLKEMREVGGLKNCIHKPFLTAQLSHVIHHAFAS